VRHPDAAALNAELVAGGVRVAEIGPERRTLEEVVLARMSSGSDRFGRPGGTDRPAGDPAPRPTPAPDPGPPAVPR